MVKSEFDVASIRRNNSGSVTQSIRRYPGGRLEAVNVPLRDLIKFAYGLSRLQIVEGTAPILDHRFDVSGRMDRDLPVVAAYGPFNIALQQLLLERFRLSAHREERPVQGFALLLAREDGRLGPQLRPSTVDCASLRDRNETPPRHPEGFSVCTITGRGDRVRAGGHSISEFATFLEFQLRSPVEDRTGLLGPFEIDVSYTLPIVALAGARLGAAPELASALPDQLGLKLERMELAIEVIVVDRVGPLAED
jgi:uncharacterized protein (TIGR03435 family)